MTWYYVDWFVLLDIIYFLWEESIYVHSNPKCNKNAWFSINISTQFLKISVSGAAALPDKIPSCICHSHICPYHEYLSYYWRDYGQPLQVGSWDHLYHIYQRSRLHLCPQQMSWPNLSVSAIYQVILTWFDQTFLS